MNFSRIIPFLLLLTYSALGQNPHELLQARLSEAAAIALTPTGKCGTPLMIDVMQIMREAPLHVRSGIEEALQRPVRETSRLGASGRFRIHYNTSDTEQPGMVGVPNSHEEYVDSVIAIFDQVWNKVIGELGFEPPPFDNGVGGGNEYDVYILSLPTGTFGKTFWELADNLESGIRQRFPSYITIDINYAGERTPGLDGLRVTVAHEFHHAIQVGAYGIWQNVPLFDFFFYELTAVWMEEVVFGEINDYYFDLVNFFRFFKDLSNRSYGFTSFSIWRGYERSVWALFLEKKYGRDIVRQIWEGMKRMPALESMDDVLKLHGSSLESDFAEFASWNLFTGFRADTVRYYNEGNMFPLLAVNASAAFSGSTSSFQGTALPLSLQYYRFDLTGDTVVAVIANSDAPRAYTAPSQSNSFSLSLSSGTVQGATQKLNNGLTVGFMAEASGEWRTRYVGMSGNADLRLESLPSPNPLRLSKSDLLILPLEDTPEGPVEVFFLTPSLDLAYSGTFAITNRIGKSEVVVPTTSLEQHLSSGVHFVHLKTPQKEYLWKVLILR
ncbi:MAG: MXAN_6640 family putative metalloprotease [Bacteroidota bacterium]